ncbi:MAG: energy transducer TonB [Cyanobacteria bacterium J06623_7]
MSYESKLERQANRLISPAQLCLVLSVGLHLLVLRFGLPSIRFNNDGGTREVSVIELNAEQQARLPDLYPQLPNPDLSELDLPQPDLNDPAAPFAIPPNLIPGITDPADLPPLVIPPPPTFDIPALPPITDITLPPVGDLSNLPLPPEINPLDFKVEPIKLPPDLGKVPEVPGDLPPVNPPDGSTAAKPNKPLDQLLNQPDTTPSERPAEPQPQETPQQIAARKLAQSQERIKNLRQSLSKTDEGTSDEEARQNYVVWLAKVKDIKPEQLEIKGVYPRDACIKRLQGSSVFGIVVNTQGEVVAADLLKGAKYPLFNRQASKDISDRTFENKTDRPKPYQVKVNYQYDPEICPSLTLPSIRKQEPVPKPKPKPQVKPAPKPESKPVPPAESEKPPAQSEPQPEPKPVPPAELESKPKPKPQPQPQPQPETQPEVPSPSLRDRLRDVPLRDIDPTKLKDIPLPERPDFN